jgi:NhaP-type Na+/H+ or K+/H+ antiporter
VTALDATTWQTAVFVVLALTVARMVPVALALFGEGFTRTTIAFMGWFGPRGMASVVFAVIAFDSMEGSDAKPVLAAITLTVLVSVVAHGLTAAPLSRRYGEGVAALPEDAPERQDVPTLASRPQTIRRHTSPAPPRSASDDTHP